MPTGPKGEKRPADVIGNAVKIMRIATGEEEEALTSDGKNAAAVSLGKRGGEARADSMTPERRMEIAKKAASLRWAAKIKWHWTLDKLHLLNFDNSTTQVILGNFKCWSITQRMHVTMMNG